MLNRLIITLIVHKILLTKVERHYTILFDKIYASSYSPLHYNTAGIYYESYDYVNFVISITLKPVTCLLESITLVYHLLWR